VTRKALQADRDDLTTVIVAAMRAQIVGALKLSAIAALVECFHFQRIVRAAVTTAMRRYFSLGDSHGGT